MKLKGKLFTILAIKMYCYIIFKFPKWKINLEILKDAFSIIFYLSIKEPENFTMLYPAVYDILLDKKKPCFII